MSTFSLSAGVSTSVAEGRTALTRGTSETSEHAPERAPAASRLGLLLFAIYLAFYVGFVLISAFASDWLETIVVGGLNLAVVYGFGLILLALILAMIYGGARQRIS